MSYSTRIDDVQASYNEFKSFLNFYLTTRLNKGFNDVNQQFSNTGLLDLNEFVKDESWLDVSTGNNFPSFFDFPMYVKSYGPGGKLGYGVTPDIGFTRNVEKKLMFIKSNMPSSQHWSSVCYGKDKFVAISDADSNIMAYSTDGISWTQGTMPSSKQWQSVCYGNGKYVAVAQNTNIIAYSTDGINWTEGNMPSSQRWWSVCYGNGKYVAVVNSTTTMAYSTDGISWTQGTMPSSSKQWQSVCYGNGKYVAVATGSTTVYSINTYSYPSLCYNEIEVGYAYPVIVQEPVINLSINEPENYYFQIINDNSSDQVFTVPFPFSSNVQYLRNNYSRLFYVGANNNKNLFAFASFYRSSSYGGLVLYVSPDLIHWNVHQLIPGTATSTEVNTLIGTTSTSLSLSSSNATIMQNALRKYVGFLPNGQYVVMYPYEMYKQSGDNMQNMAVLYSPYQNEPLMTINDPYGDEDWENKAINGISAIIDQYDYFVIYYNNRLNCPISLGLGELINTNTALSISIVGQNIGIPIIVKSKNNYNEGVNQYLWNCDANKDNNSRGGTLDIDAPLLTTAICTLDKEAGRLEHTPADVRLCSAVGNYGTGKYKSVTLLIKEPTTYAGNIDEDMSDYITEFYSRTSSGNYDNSTQFGISILNRTIFAYVPTNEEITEKKTTVRITAIGDTASKYLQTTVNE